MTPAAARYSRLAAALRDHAAAVPPSHWENPSPCTEWTAREVVAHVAEAHLMQLGLADAGPEHVPDPHERPVEALDAVIPVVESQLGSSETALRTIQGHTGEMTLEDAVDTFLCFDLLIHRWDLARAVGLPEALDADDVSWAEHVADGFGDMLHAEGVCGPALEPPQDADAQTRLLARLGRRSW